MHSELSSQAQAFWSTIVQVFAALFIAFVVESGASVRQILERRKKSRLSSLRRIGAGATLTQCLVAAIVLIAGVGIGLVTLSAGHDSEERRSTMTALAMLAGSLILTIPTAQFYPRLAVDAVSWFDCILSQWRCRRKGRAGDQF